MATATGLRNVINAVRADIAAAKTETKTALDEADAAIAAKAPLASPVFTGTPKVPSKTSAAGTDGTLIATEAQVKTVADSDALKAPIASPAFTGTPAAPTAAAATNSTQIATTAFVHAKTKLDAWPAGSFYTQYPLSGQSAIANMFPSSGSPATLFGGTWTEMYAGEKVFFMGGLSSLESNRSSGIQQDAIRNITGYYYNVNANDGCGLGSNGMQYGGAFYRYGSLTHWAFAGYVREAADLGFDASLQVPTDTTNHPKNRPVKVWRRTACKENNSMAERFITVLNGVVTGVHHGDMDALFDDTSLNTHGRVAVGDGAEVRPLDRVDFYTPDWKRKTDAELVAEGLVEVPSGLKLNADGAFEPMSREERVIAGIDAPEPGFKVEGGRIAAMSLSEKLGAGVITREEYAAGMAGEAEAEFSRRLAPLNTEEAKAMAEVDPEYAAARKAKLLALLAVKKQPGWPLDAEWPEADGD